MVNADNTQREWRRRGRELESPERDIEQSNHFRCSAASHVATGKVLNIYGC